MPVGWYCSLRHDSFEDCDGHCHYSFKYYLYRLGALRLGLDGIAAILMGGADRLEVAS